ncbi:MAG: T9SS type A sorting domain-containing protein [Bacteroidetes bacterium]|nr:T9SS type A sorting domain-containing protein [Bacteroidota bacterium]
MKIIITIFFLSLFVSLHSQNIDWDNSGKLPNSPIEIQSSEGAGGSDQLPIESIPFTIVNSFPAPINSLGDLAYDGKSLWLGTFDGLIYKINPQDGSAIDSIMIPFKDIGGISFGHNYLWAAQNYGDTIYKINPTTKTIVGTITHSLGDYIHGMQFVDGNMMVNMFYLGTTDTTFVLDTTGAVISKTPNHFAFAHGLSSDGCNIWMTANSFGANNDAYLFQKNPVTFATIDSVLVPGGSFANGIVWDGNYLWLANNFSDSIYQLQLNVATSTTSMIFENACGEYLSPGGKLWVSSGVYLDTIPNVAGCDSLMTIDVTINTVDTSVSVNFITLTSNAADATYQWIDCNNGNIALAGETGQSFTASVNGNYAVVVSQNDCQDTSACYAINTVGIYNNSFGEALSVFPNPSNGSFVVDLGQQYTGVSVVITSVTGQVVFERNFQSIQKQRFDLDIPGGLYLMSLSSKEGQTGVVKMVVN